MVIGDYFKIPYNIITINSIDSYYVIGHFKLYS
jgi:hypothetical protein